MNNERRHELQQNDLAIYLDKINKSIEPYSRIIAVLVGAALIGAIGFGFYNSQQSGQRSDATLQLIQASASQDAEDLASVSDAYAGTTAGDWARMYQGESYLSQGIQSLYQDRENAEGLLDDAQAIFRSAAKSNDQILRSRAHLGNARAAESLGNLDEAIEAYNQVIAVHESDAMVKKAETRIAALSTPQTKAFLAWFGDQDFSPADPSLPPSLPGADSLPGIPDLKLPELNFGDEDEKQLQEGGLEMPADQKSDTEKKSEAETKTDTSANEKEVAPPLKTEEKAADPVSAADKAPVVEKEPATEKAEPTAEEEPSVAEEEPAAETAPAVDAESEESSDQ